jgi:hypothetical protein
MKTNTHSAACCVFLVTSLASASIANAGCLDALTSTASIESVVRGFYVNAAAFGSEHYVILDKATCTASPSNGGDVVLGSLTKSSYFVRFNASDKFLLQTLMLAKTLGEPVRFRLAPTTSPGPINDIAYVVSPADADAQ